MCAWLGDPRQAVAALYEKVEGARYGRERLGFMTQSAHKTGAIVPEVAYCVAATSGRHTGNDWSRSYISYKDRVRRPTATESERLQGFPADWTVPECTFPASARGFDSERYRAIGNAVAVPVVKWVADRIVPFISPRKKNKVTDVRELISIAPDLGVKSRVSDVRDAIHEVDDGVFVHRWMSGGCAWGNFIIEGAASAAPSKIIASRFVDVLDAEIPDSRYFLTANAAAGIIRRADIVGRTLFPPMRLALENMACRIHRESPILTNREPAGKMGAERSVRKIGAHKRRTIQPAG